MFGYFFERPDRRHWTIFFPGRWGSKMIAMNSSAQRHPRALPVGFLGLLEPPAVGEEPLHVHLALGDELGALGLALLRERPRPHQRDLPAQEIGADVERHLTPLADETGGAPRAYGAHRRGTGVRRRGGVERLVRALAVRGRASPRGARRPTSTSQGFCSRLPT
jgi:hypothetical protein